MIFSRKYVFETKNTRLIRRFMNVLFSFVILGIGLCIFCVYLPIHGRNASVESTHFFYKKAPDLIAIFTGDQGRIPFGVEVSKLFPSAKIYISGVNSTNSAQAIVDEDDSSVVNFIEIDYSAKNTVDNVTKTLDYLRENMYLKDILIVSSDYHILRIKMLMGHYTRPEDKFRFHYYGTTTNYTSRKNIKKLLVEFIKFFRSVFFILTND